MNLPKPPCLAYPSCFIVLFLPFKNVFLKIMFYKSVLEAVKAITKIVPDDYLDAKQDHFKILIPMI